MKLKIKKLATVQMGYSFRARLEASENGEVAVIQMKDLLDNNTVGCSELVRNDMKIVKEHHLVHKKDLIFRSRGQITTAAILLENLDKAVVAAPLLRIRIIKPDKVLAEYLNWYINQRDAQMFLTSRAKGTFQKTISKETIEDMEIVLPTLAKQKQIVELTALAEREQTLLRTLADKREQYITALLMKCATIDTKEGTTNGHK
ncbi:MAG: restriction endonuclease subunit S [Victivallaceae bacterium]|nr:restriction endonuclease subunit S [Victivallaceae bacterium]